MGAVHLQLAHGEDVHADAHGDDERVLAHGATLHESPAVGAFEVVLRVFEVLRLVIEGVYGSF